MQSDAIITYNNQETLPVKVTTEKAYTTNILKRSLSSNFVNSLSPTISPTQILNQSANYRVARNLKVLLRKTTGLVSPIQSLNPNNNGSQSSTSISSLGPATYSPSVREILEYIRVQKSSIISEKLIPLCKKLREEGINLQKITRSKQKWYLFRLDEENSMLTWKSGNKKLEFDSIRDIRIGNMASNYREEYGVPDNYTDMWMTIIYSVSNKLKALHIIAEDKNKFDLFFNCICGLVSKRRQLMESISMPNSEKFANIHWNTTVSEREDDKAKDKLSFAEVTKLCRRFHIFCSKDYLWKLFTIADVNNNQLLNFSEFQSFVKLLRERKDIIKLWSTLALGDDSINFDQFYKFLRNVQKETNLSQNDCKATFLKYTDQNSELMLKEGFHKFLTEQTYLDETFEAKMDYSKPLNHYFIASSHNTYLLGKQIGDTPSVEGYIQVLQQGCRCVEIDIWDDEAGPVVCHGVLTSAIPFINVIKVIRKYAFLSSPFPLIISLEIHCNRENQQLVSDILKEILGDLIYAQHDDNEILSSPSELKHKIIIKAKRSKTSLSDLSLSLTTSGINATHSAKNISSSTYDNSSSVVSSQNELEAEDNSTSAANGNASSTSISISSQNHRTSEPALVSTNDPTGIKRIKRIGNFKKRAPVIKEILNISSVYGLKFRNFSLPESKTMTHCFSLNEKKLDVMCKDTSQKLSIDKHNRRHLMRIYPHVFRYKSSNFNPIKFWKLGIQMVAINWQTNDLGQQINLAMFQLSNQKNEISHSGYILKPASLNSTVSKIKDIPILYSKIQKKLSNNPLTIKIHVLSGQLLPNVEKKESNKHDFAPYVTLRFINDKESLVQPVHKIKNGLKISDFEVNTSKCPGNGFNPLWKTEAEISLSNLDFAFVQFTVKTEDVPLAVCCVKLEYLKQGYRNIPLYNMEGEPFIFSTLFIYSEIYNDYI